MVLSKLLEGIEYECLQGNLETEINDIVYDSKKAKEQSVFICIEGTKTDSHNFIDEVAALGVNVVVIEKKIPLPEKITAVFVPSSRIALAKMSATLFGHPAARMITIGVTGTKGKTTTTYMIKEILETAGKKVGLIGTNGVMIAGAFYPTMNTTPESYQLQEYFYKMAEAGCEYMIMEVSSQGLKMHRVDGITFDYGIFTNISPDHIGPDEHADFAEYLHYKGELFKKCRIGLVNADDPNLESLLQEHTCELFTYGVKNKADFKVAEVNYLTEHNFVGISFRVKGKKSKESLLVKVNIPGEFNVYNALAAISLSSFLNINEDAVLKALASIIVEGRMEIIHSSEQCTIIVDYAHNAVSMESLLTTLRMYHPKRLVCIFGCGGNRSKLRRYDMGEIGGRLADLSIITADNSRFEKVEDILTDIKTGLQKTEGTYMEIPDRREAITYSIRHTRPGDMIVIIGKGHENYQEIEGVRYPFLDKAVVKEILEELKISK